MWHDIADTAELDRRIAFPVAVDLACLYDVPSYHGDQYAYVILAEYNGQDFGRRGGGPLDPGLVPTHWAFRPEPPPEADMLRVALRSVRVASGEG